ncbi:hypothetical protein H5410_039764 [Solanum commersonii]|uniref:Uncharacterized protein n=1 Tax=Solanum commersonii TaxID=4109 RepID=A0A9J5XN53_SOLCO|nr:hypothetical protein H5410_039764 [Solanum commersonii]
MEKILLGAPEPAKCNPDLVGSSSGLKIISTKCEISEVESELSTNFHEAQLKSINGNNEKSNRYIHEYYRIQGKSFPSRVNSCTHEGIVEVENLGNSKEFSLGLDLDDETARNQITEGPRRK